MAQPPVVLALARDLCLKLIEKRGLSASHLSKALSDLAAVGQAIFAESESLPGVPLLRLAGALTACQIDKGWIGKTASVAENLAQNARVIIAAARPLPPARAKEILSLALSLIIKLVETTGVSSATMEGVFQEIVASLRDLADRP
ncbi:MAG: hypothetical protein LBE01_04470 [Deltaproteobacteria bacterium]|jgi:hypothetical protein|nr:hypothetical protein [Deltaproteobacteria bacterium]